MGRVFYFSALGNMKILIIRFSSIGDIVLTTPVVRCLKEQLEEVEIHYLTKRKFAEVLDGNPYLDKVLVFDQSLSEILALLKYNKYDLIVDLHKNFRSKKVKNYLGIKSVSYHKYNIAKWLLVNFKKDMMPASHIVDRYFQAVNEFGITNDGGGLNFYAHHQNKEVLDDLPPAFVNNYVAVVVGAMYETKAMPTEKLARLCQNLDLPVVLLGGQKEKDRGEAIKELVGDKAFNACGNYSLGGSAAFIMAAKKVISHDTGMMHIAAALDKEMVSIWGNTVPAFGMSPYYSPKSNTISMIAEVKNLACRPCTKLGYNKCPKKHFKCMNEIKESEIISFVNQ